MDFPLVRSAASENDEETRERFEGMSNALTQIKTGAVVLINSPLNTVALTGAEGSDIVAGFSRLPATNVELKANRAHAEIGAYTWLLPLI